MGFPVTGYNGLEEKDVPYFLKHKPEFICPKCECPYFTGSTISYGRWLSTDVLYSCVKCDGKVVYLVNKCAAITLEHWLRVQAEEKYNALRNDAIKRVEIPS